MARILVAGNVNIETTVQVEGFPIAYQPVSYPFFGIGSRVSAVGYNIAKALTALGDSVRLAALIGSDSAADTVRATLAADGIDDRYVLGQTAQTPQSVVLYDGDGRRHAFTDLKDVLEQTYPADLFAQALDDCALAVLTNIAYCRPLLALAQGRGTPIASDLHALSDLDDAYNQPFLEAATILFMSGERLPIAPEQWIAQLFARYPAELVGIGQGAEGALLHVRRSGQLIHVPAVAPRGVVSTGGAGDALFAAFVHCIAAGFAPAQALRYAVMFAGYKVGAASSGEGFVSHAQLEQLVKAS